MKFLIDEQLPAILADWLSSKGFDAVHALTLSTNTSLSDKEIRQWSMSEKRAARRPVRYHKRRRLFQRLYFPKRTL